MHRSRVVALGLLLSAAAGGASEARSGVRKKARRCLRTRPCDGPSGCGSG